MSVPRNEPGEAIRVLAAADARHSAQTVTLVKTALLEVIRLVLPAGKQLAQHRVTGEIMLQCISGNATLEVEGKSWELGEGTLTYLTGGQEHSLTANEDSSLLLTILLAPKNS